MFRATGGLGVSVKEFNDNTLDLNADDLRKLRNTLGQAIDKLFHVLEASGIEAVKDGIAGGAGPVAIFLTIAQGWPTVRPKLVTPSLYVAVALAALGAALSEAKRHKTALKAQAGHIETIALFTGLLFILQTELASIVFAVDLKNPHKEVDLSTGKFAGTLIGAAFFPAMNLLAKKYSVDDINPSESFKMRAFKKFIVGLDVTSSIVMNAALAHATGSTIAAFSNKFSIDGSNQDANAYVQFCMYIASALAGILLTIGMKLSKKNMSSLLGYLDGMNVIPFLYESFSAAMEDKNATPGDKTLLILLWSSVIAMPLFLSAGARLLNSCRQKQSAKVSVVQEENGEEIQVSSRVTDNKSCLFNSCSKSAASDSALESNRGYRKH